MSTKEQPRLERDGLQAGELVQLAQILNDLDNSFDNLNNDPAPAVKKRTFYGKQKAASTAPKDYRAAIKKDAERLQAILNEWRQRPKLQPPHPYNTNFHLHVGGALAELHALVTKKDEDINDGDYLGVMRLMMEDLQEVVNPNPKPLNPPDWRPSNPQSAERKSK